MTDSHSIIAKVRKRTPRGVSAMRGVSLIEVLVVLVLLVTGILVIIRLYPSGFFSIQSTGNAALADGLGNAALGTQAQDADSLPESIQPVHSPMTIPPFTNDLVAATTPADAGYDPEDPNNLNNARRVLNETIAVPTLSGGISVYAVKYGPVVMPANPATSVAALPNYFTVNSTYWTALPGNSALATVAGSNDLPQDTLVPGQESFLVDLTAKRIAVPYAPYTLTGGAQTPANTAPATSYPQKMVVVITTDAGVFTKYLNVPAGTPRDDTNPYAPYGSDNHAYLPDTPTANGNYQGGWFDPTDDTVYGDLPTAGTSPPPTAVWLSVKLYRPYQGILTVTEPTTPAFSHDPYEFTLTSGNIGGVYPGASPGAIQFNPLATKGNGTSARKVQISYVVSSWEILREDHDIPALSGTSTAIIRTAVPNIRQAGSARPDNSIDPGIAGSGKSIYILDLDKGTLVGPPGAPDPTNPDAPIVDEDTQGTPIAPNAINVSFATGRLTFGSNAFSDNPNGTTPQAHRVRIFYGSELGWNVAVQKAASYFNLSSASATVGDTTPLLADQYALNTSSAYIYFARCNAGKTVEIDGTYTDSNGASKTFTDAISIDPTLNTVGASNVRVVLTDGTKLGQPVPNNPVPTDVKITAVRGLSARAVVAWKERDQWKVHSVDTVLNRTP